MVLLHSNWPIVYVMLVAAFFGTTIASAIGSELNEDGKNEQKARSLMDDFEASASQLNEATLESTISDRSVKGKKNPVNASNTNGNGIIDVILKSAAVQAILEPSNIEIILNSRAFKNLLNPAAVEHFLNSKIAKQILSPEMLGNILNSDTMTSKLTPEFIEQLLESVVGVSGAGDQPDFMKALLKSKLWKSLPRLGSLKLLVCSDVLGEKDSGGAAIIQTRKQKPSATSFSTKFAEVEDAYYPLQSKTTDEAYLSKYRNPYEYNTQNTDESEPNDPYRSSNGGDDLYSYQYKPSTPKKYNPLAPSQLSFSSKPSTYQSGWTSKPYASSYSYTDPASAISSGVLGLLGGSSPYSSSYSNEYPPLSASEKVNYTTELLNMFIQKPYGSSSTYQYSAKKKKPLTSDSLDFVESLPSSDDKLPSSGTTSDELFESPSLDSQLSSATWENTANLATKEDNSATQEDKSDGFISQGDSPAITITVPTTQVPTPAPVLDSPSTTTLPPTSELPKSDYKVSEGIPEWGPVLPASTTVDNPEAEVIAQTTTVAPASAESVEASPEEEDSETNKKRGTGKHRKKPEESGEEKKDPSPKKRRRKGGKRKQNIPAE